jgi:hypothetical protein
MHVQTIIAESSPLNLQFKIPGNFVGKFRDAFSECLQQGRQRPAGYSQLARAA